MNNISRCIAAVAAIAGIMFQSGCATQQTSGSSASTRTAPATTTQKAEPSRPTPAPMSVRQSGYGPSYSTFDRGGVTHVAGSMAYPTGVLDSSSVLVEKVVPQEILVGAPYTIEYVVKNITDVSLKDVVLTDQIGENFNISRTSPEADEVNGNTATWMLGELGPRQERRIVINGSSAEEGYLETCADLTFTPAFCETIRIVKGDLQLVKNLPQYATTCEVIPMTMVVTNTGSGKLTNVVVTDDLPRGLRTSEGETRLNYNVGDLNPGESREFNVNLMASATGKYDNVANASSSQNITATDGASVTVQAPDLSVSCDAPDERFIGRPFTVCYTVMNNGDAASTNSQLVMPIPAGLNFQGATGNGRIEGDSVVWNIGTLSPEASRELCATFTSSDARRFALTGTLTGDCADSESTTCNVRVQGIPAILLEVIDLDDPIVVGSNVVYEIVVTNQGSADATGVKIVCELEAEQRFVSASGTTTASTRGQTIDMAPVGSISPGEKASWQVTVRALEAANVRFSVNLESDQITRSVTETESTNQY